MLPLSYRLRRSEEIKQVRQHGQSRHHPLLVMVYYPNNRPMSRFAFIASKHVGHAVARNRAKRLLREAVRHYLPMIEPGWDCVFIAREATSEASYAAVDSAVAQVLARAKLIG
jgi:ribonuclease P protein component